MAKILALVGSLRKDSFNGALARAAAQLMPSGSSLDLAFIHDIPLYDGDVEKRGLPDSVKALKERVSSADGLLLVSPEYNNSVPGVLKNTIDWLSRPASDIPRVFGGRATGVIGASDGQGGTRLAQVAWLPVLRTLGAHAFFEKTLYVASAEQAFDAELRLKDEKLKERLGAYLVAFVRFADNGQIHARQR
jgi:NAD(P)H-dependent FMN reductase